MEETEHSALSFLYQAMNPCCIQTSLVKLEQFEVTETAFLYFNLRVVGLSLYLRATALSFFKYLLKMVGST